MKIIVDTNVLISGIFFSGVPLIILEEIFQEKFQPVITDTIAEEYQDSINKISKRFPDINAQSQLKLFISSSIICEPVQLTSPVSNDPDDDKFITCAIACKAKIIVSGDKHLLDISGYSNIEVLKPRVFADRYLK